MKQNGFPCRFGYRKKYFGPLFIQLGVVYMLWFKFIFDLKFDFHNTLYHVHYHRMKGNKN